MTSSKRTRFAIARTRFVGFVSPPSHNPCLLSWRIPKRLTTAAALFVVACLPVLPARASQWSDTFIGYRYGTDYREPTISRDVTKSIVQFQHVDGYKYGSNFLNVDTLLSDSKDPAAGGGSGATEIYIVYRHTLSYSKVTGDQIKWGPINDIGLTTGFDLNAKNNAFAPRERKIFVGPTINFNVPGFLSIGPQLYQEWNHEGITSPGKDITFKTTYCIAAAWGIPFKLGLPVVFKGFANYIGRKGKDGFGNETAPEFLMETALMFDVGSIFGQKNTFYAGGGYQYWHNKFGSDASKDPSGGSIASVPQIQFEVHF
jgi:nucleoside-specific outer membrane channel protein Tsx